MNDEHHRVLQQCTHGSQSGDMNFAEIVGSLAAIGVERYHTDYSRGEMTYYLADGDSHVVPVPRSHQPIAQQFDASAVAAAVVQSQRGEHTYADFVTKTMAAGCVGYFVQIAGRRVQYFGRHGDCHVEWFPSGK